MMLISGYLCKTKRKSRCALAFFATDVQSVRAPGAAAARAHTHAARNAHLRQHLFLSAHVHVCRLVAVWCRPIKIEEIDDRGGSE